MVIVVTQSNQTYLGHKCSQPVQIVGKGHTPLEHVQPSSMKGRDDGGCMHPGKHLSVV